MDALGEKECRPVKISISVLPLLGGHDGGGYSLGLGLLFCLGEGAGARVTEGAESGAQSLE